MTLLSIVSAVTGRLSLPTPTTVSGSTDRQVLQLWGLANEEGTALMRDYDWQALTKEQEFTTLNQAYQAAAIPSDLDRYLPNSFFNRTTRRPMTGPITPREWQWIQAQPVYSTVYLAFRERTGQFLVAPSPAAGNDCYFEYVSNLWAASATGTAQTSFLVDTDTTVLDEELITLGLRWRFLQAKGLDYAEAMATYERQKEMVESRDGGNTMLSLAPQPIDLNRVNLPDGSFGV